MDKNYSELKTEFEELNKALDYLVQNGNSFKAETEKTENILKWLNQCNQNQLILHKETKDLNEKADRVLEEAKSSLVTEIQNINDKVNKTLTSFEMKREENITFSIFKIFSFLLFILLLILFCFCIILFDLE